MKRWLRFRVIVWVGAVVAVLWLLGGPVVRSEWARRHWTRTDCRAESDGIRYEYVVGDVQYMAQRRKNFWEPNPHADDVKPTLVRTMDKPNATCYVNPQDPTDTVLHVDALADWQDGLGRMVVSLFLLAAVWLVTVFGERKRRAAGGRAGASDEVKA